MKDKTYWLLSIVGLLLVFLGIAYIFLELRRLGPSGGPTMLLGFLVVVAGMAMEVIAGRRGKEA